MRCGQIDAESVAFAADIRLRFRIDQHGAAPLNLDLLGFNRRRSSGRFGQAILLLDGMRR